MPYNFYSTFSVIIAGSCKTAYIFFSISLNQAESVQSISQPNFKTEKINYEKAAHIYVRSHPIGCVIS
jgi:hypothetical protein